MNNVCVFRLRDVSVRLSSNGSNGDGKVAEVVGNENSGSDSYEQDIKTKILQSSLPYVPQHGWSRDTIAAGTNN